MSGRGRRIEVGDGHGRWFTGIDKTMHTPQQRSRRKEPQTRDRRNSKKNGELTSPMAEKR